MTSRRRPSIAKELRGKRLAALARGELEQRDSFGRAAPASPTSPHVRTVDAGTRAMIDAAIAEREPKDA